MARVEIESKWNGAPRIDQAFGVDSECGASAEVGAASESEAGNRSFESTPAAPVEENSVVGRPSAVTGAGSRLNRKVKAKITIPTLIAESATLKTGQNCTSKKSTT